MYVDFEPIWERAGPRSIREWQDYVYGLTTSAGAPRLVAPKHISGVDRATMAVLGDDCADAGAYVNTVGCLGFAEQPPESVVHEIFHDFIDFSYAGIDSMKRCFSGVQHLKRLKVSGEPSVDVHFLFLPQLLGCGRLFAPYFCGAAWYGYHLWCERINYLHHLASPFDPGRRRVTSPRILGSDTAVTVDLKREVGRMVADAWSSGRLQGRDDVLDVLAGMRGATAKHNKHGVTLTVEGLSRPLLLNAPVFAPNFDGDDLRDRLAKQKRKTREEIDAEFRRILQLRADEHFRRFGTPKLRWTYTALAKSTVTKEPNAIRYHTTAGRLWAATLGIDQLVAGEVQHLESALHRVGESLRVLAATGPERVDIKDETREGHDLGEATVGELARATLQLEHHARHLDEALGHRRGAVGGIRGAAALARIGAALDRAVDHVARRRLGIPRQAAIVERALIALFRGDQIAASEQRWFTLSPVVVRGEVIDSLRKTDRVGCADLEETSRYLGSFSWNPTAPSRPLDEIETGSRSCP